MHLSSTFMVSLLLVGAKGVLGGSRFFEAKAPNKRTNPSPEYPDLKTLNTTSSIVRRAISITHRPTDNGAPRIWPNKKIRYCFEQRPAPTVIEGLWDQARVMWAELEDHGFSYEHVSDADCIREVSSVLRIHYNTLGKLASTLGIPPIDEEYNRENPATAIYGPYTHLSDLAGIGQDDINANVAHELGHVWGLLHEHQNPQRWKVSAQNNADGWGIPSVAGADIRFETKDFNCRNLKDYDTNEAEVRRKIQEARDAQPPNTRLADSLESDLGRRCISQQAATRIGFSAGDWIPFAQTGKYFMDDKFDELSLMMYPSGAGGNGLSDARDVIMRYRDGTPIPNRDRPSTMDIARLLALYDVPASAPPGEPHNSGSSNIRNKFRALRSKGSRFFSRAGDTSAGIC
jgi:hypothetical protein